MRMNMFPMPKKLPMQFWRKVNTKIIKDWVKAERLTHTHIPKPAVFWFYPQDDGEDEYLAFAVEHDSIVINEKFVNDNLELFLDSVVPHEVAHCFMDKLYPHLNKYQHCSKWKKMALRIASGKEIFEQYQAEDEETLD